MEIITVKTELISPNKDNPRVIKNDTFKKLVKSIKDFPEMLQIRPIVVNEAMTILGGNMRWKACVEAGMAEVPIIIAKGLTPEQQREFLIKDNISGGEWDWSLIEADWDTDLLEDWGLSVWQGDDLSNVNDYDGLDQESKLDKFLSAELKRMFLVYDNDTFQNVINWFNKLQQKHELGNHSQVILKIMENEDI